MPENNWDAQSWILKLHILAPRQISYTWSNKNDAKISSGVIVLAPLFAKDDCSFIKFVGYVILAGIFVSGTVR